MRKPVVLIALVVVALLLASCEGGYTTTGGSTRSGSSGGGGWIEVSSKTANGTMSESIDEENESLDSVLMSGDVLECDVTLTAGSGTFKIELLGADDAVTLTLESQDGKTVSGNGQIVANVFADAAYRVTALEAKDVSYRIDYTLQ
jgi:hypothetical protein